MDGLTSILLGGIAGLGLGALGATLFWKGQASQQLQNVQTQHEAERFVLQSQLDDARNQLTQWKQSLDGIFRDQFEALSLKTLHQVREELEQRATQQYEAKQVQLNQSIQQLLTPLNQMIQEHQQKVTELEKQHLTDSTALATQIKALIEQNRQSQEEKNRLVSLLSDNKGRGDWGEFQLERLLDLSGLIKGQHYEMQATQADQRRPDVQIFLPNNRCVFIDVKTLIGTLEALHDTSLNDETHPETRKKLADSLAEQINKLSVKDYETKNQNSVDFVILYVPRESMLRIPLEENPLLSEKAFQKRIVLASPLILMAILKTIAHGWREAHTSDNAKQILSLAEKLHEKLNLFLDRFVGLDTAIQSVHKKYEDAMTTLTGRQGVLAQVKTMEAFGVKSKKTMPEALSQKLAMETLDLPEETDLLATSAGDAL